MTSYDVREWWEGNSSKPRLLMIIKARETSPKLIETYTDEQLLRCSTWVKLPFDAQCAIAEALLTVWCSVCDNYPCTCQSMDFEP